ncbi:MAG: serine/threonine-protein kinase [Mastigocoleus sp. MO_167.B18]|nr:serine/threonine-protein kinase [Mastigocoleus sp. MO_167.B18]
MEVYCTRPGCPRPKNYFSDLENYSILRTVQQKYCTTCGMPLILAGRYLPEKLLGKGGFGTAFLAIDRYTPGMRRCVVKQFQPTGNLSQTQMQLAQDLFEREAIVLEELGNQHEQIPALFAYFPLLVENLNHQEEQFFYLVQEYIDGQTIEEELVNKGRFTQFEIVDILRDILNILQFVHKKNIIHRDIKPSNIMRHRNGKLFLLDFGAVKQVTNNPIGSNRSSTGIYSLGFSPPEQISGGQVFPCTDLYALAVTAITLLTGEQEVNKLFDARSNQIEWRSRVQVNSNLGDILDRMLIAAANQRFGTATEVLEALNKLSIVPQTQHSETNKSMQSKIQTPVIITSKPTTIPKTKINRSFSSLEILFGAAFTGFEGTLIAIALLNLLSLTLVSLICAAVVFLMLIFSQINRWLEKQDLLIISAITSLILFFIPLLRGNLGMGDVIILSCGISLIAVAITSIFSLVHKLLSLLL